MEIDWNYWTAGVTATLREAALLSVARNPKRVNKDKDYWSAGVVAVNEQTGVWSLPSEMDEKDKALLGKASERIDMAGRYMKSCNPRWLIRLNKEHFLQTVVSLPEFGAWLLGYGHDLPDGFPGMVSQVAKAPKALLPDALDNWELLEQKREITVWEAAQILTRTSNNSVTEAGKSLICDAIEGGGLAASITRWVITDYMNGDSLGGINQFESTILHTDLEAWMAARGLSMPATTSGTPEMDALPVPPENEGETQTKPWLIADPRDPEPEQPWYTPARYFARALVKDDPTLLVKTSILADKVAMSLAKVNIYKRGGKKPLLGVTVLKAFSKISLG